MTTLREAAQQALEALEDIFGANKVDVGAINALRAALAEPQSTHSADCYKWHHECAIARIEELKLLCEEMLSELYVYRASKHLKDVTAAIRARGDEQEYKKGYADGYAAGYDNGDSEGFTRGTDSMVPESLAAWRAETKPLTDEQIRDLWSWAMTAEAERTATTQQHAFARAIERAHGIGDSDE